MGGGQGQGPGAGRRGLPFAAVGLVAVTAGLTFAVTATPAVADASGPQGIEQLVDRYVDREMAEQNIPGAAVTVIAGGEQVLNKGYGLADVERGVPVDPDRSRFLVGSQAKLFTAQAALQLVHAGKLDLDADVNTYLRDFTIADTFPGRPVTLRHLLTHTAGFDESDMVGFLTHREPLAEGLARYQPARVRAPGSGVVYNNYALALAGHLVELAAGVSYDDYVDTHVFGPLGMNDSSTRCLGAGDTVAYLGDGSPTDADCAYSTPGGTGPSSTPADVGRYLHAQLTHDPRLGPGIAAEMQSIQHTEHPRLRGMGYVFEHIQHDGHPLLFKGGEMPGMNSYLVMIPELDLGLNVVANGDGTGGDGIDGIELAERIVETYLPHLPPPAARPVPGAGVEKYEGWYQAGRTSRDSMYRTRALLREPVHVTGNRDGSLHTTGLSGGPKDWDRTEPDVFAERGGWGLIAFPEPGQLAISGSTNVFDRITLSAHPQLHLGMLGFAAGTAILALVCFPLLAAVRRVRDRPVHPRGARLVRVLGWTSAAVMVAVLVGFGALLSDESTATVTVLEGRPALLAVLVLATLTVPLAGLLLIGTLRAWWSRWWSLSGRVAFTVLTLGALCFAAVAVEYNLLGPPYT